MAGVSSRQTLHKKGAVQSQWPEGPSCWTIGLGRAAPRRHASSRFRFITVPVKHEESVCAICMHVVSFQELTYVGLHLRRDPVPILRLRRSSAAECTTKGERPGCCSCTRPYTREHFRRSLASDWPADVAFVSEVLIFFRKRYC